MDAKQSGWYVPDGPDFWYCVTMVQNEMGWLRVYIYEYLQD